jgi:hypothetical protein
VEYLIYTKSRQVWPVSAQPVVEGMNHIQGRYWLMKKLDKKYPLYPLTAAMKRAVEGAYEAGLLAGMGENGSEVMAKRLDVINNRLKAYEMYAAKLEKRCKDLTFLAILFSCTTLALLAFVGLKGL